MTDWRSLTVDERRRFLLVLEGIRRGAVAHSASVTRSSWDEFMIKATAAAMAELRKADEA